MDIITLHDNVHEHYMITYMNITWTTYMNITWTTKHVTYLLQQTDCMAITSTCLLHMHAALHTITRHCACTNNNTHVYDGRHWACARARARAHTKRMRGRGYQGPLAL